jgi:hypothetical protein
MGTVYLIEICKLSPEYPSKKQPLYGGGLGGAHGERRASMTSIRRLKWVFDIDIETCSECSGDMYITASIEDPMVIRKILAHLDDKATTGATIRDELIKVLT